MRKFVPIVLVSFAALFLCLGIVKASPCAGFETALVPCGQVPSCPCELTDIFVMIDRVYNFIVRNIALPLATLLIVIGGVMWIFSGANPAWAGRAKKILWGAGLGLLLVFGSWIIIDTVLKAVGYTGTWYAPF